MNSKTPEEIAAQIQRLRELRPNIVPRTYFGDDNLGALDIEIECLEEGWDEDYIEENLEDQNLNMHALIALRWKLGEQEEEDSANLDDGWPLK